MVDGEASVMMMAMISSNTPSRFRIAVSGGGGAVELYLGKTPSPRCFQVRGYM
jgi:hypothetical protein